MDIVIFGMVVGTTTIDGEAAIVVSQASSNGVSSCAYKISELGKSGNWERITSPELMTFRVSGVSSDTTYANL